MAQHATAKVAASIPPKLLPFADELLLLLLLVSTALVQPDADDDDAADDRRGVDSAFFVVFDGAGDASSFAFFRAILALLFCS